MKKRNKYAILQIIDEMIQIHEKISYENIVDNIIYIELQQSAILIGKYLEKFSVDVSIINHLEEYCEYLFQLANGDCESKGDTVVGLLLQIKQEVHTFFKKGKKKILFLPYKASMWDAFDSIYRCIVKKTDAIIQVMPVPYYNLKMGVNIIDTFYEGNCFPDYLNIVNYQSYDWDLEEPDIIFIHNPYDQYNYVTRLDDKFFSKNLKEYTDHLVYIPYDVANEQTFDQSMANLPGVVNSWKVYVQSENIREKYLKTNSPSKIVALGTPKLDCLINEKYLKEYIGEELPKRIKGRKTFFWNTHLSSILSNRKSFLENVLYVLNIFEGNPNIFLLWRPHPLLMQTAKSMNENYVGILEEVFERTNHIENCYLDLTTDMHEAIAVSDAYIGDRGSVLMLYGATGKPMYLFDCMLKRHVADGYRVVRFLDNYEDDNYIWMFSSQYNALFRYDKTEKRTEYIGKAEGEKLHGTFLYRECFKWKNKLFLIPLAAKQLLLVQEKKDKIKTVGLPLGQRCEASIAVVAQRGNSLWMISHFLDDDVYEVDLVSNHIKHHVAKGVEFIMDYDEKAPFWTTGVVDEAGIWVSSYQKNLIAYYNYSEFKVYKVDRIGCGEGFQSCALDGDKLWLIPKLGMDICIWDRKTKQVSYVNEFPEFLKMEKIMPFKKILYANQKMWIIPNNCNRIFYIDTIIWQIHVLNIFLDGNLLNFKESDFEGAKILDNCLILPPNNLDCEISIDTLTDNVSYKKYYIPESWDQTTLAMEANINLQNNYTENYMFHSTSCSLEWFIHYVLSEKDGFQDERKDNILAKFCGIDGNAGEKIWDNIMENLEQEDI